MEPFTSIAAMVIALATAADGWDESEEDSATRQMITYLAQTAAMVAAMRTREGHEYVNVADYVLDRGEHYPVEELTEEELAYIAEVMRVSRWPFEAKQCFANGQYALLNDFDKRFSYVEGYALGQAVIPVHHGWLTINGKPVELTWRDVKRADFWTAEPFVQPWKSFAYFGVTFDRDEVMRRLDESGGLCTFLDDWEGGWPELRKPRLKPFPTT